jgi:hypothetical protein
MQPKETPTKVITGKVRLSYEHIWKPVARDDGTEVYGCSLIIPKSDTKTINAINKATDAAIELGKSKLGKVNRSALKLPLRDGDEDRPDDENYKNSYFINANTQTAPEIVDSERNPIRNQYDVYSGCYVRTSLNFYAFSVKGNKGIAAGLGNIQKLEDGEPLSGRTSAADDFADDDDFLN